MSSIVGPLNFAPPNNVVEKKGGVNGNHVDVLCLFCSDKYHFPEEKDDILAHLFLQHKFVIADVEEVAILDEYLRCWRETLQERSDPKEFCTVMLLNHLPDGTKSENVEYLLLSDDLRKDYDLRTRLHNKRLETILTQHQFELTDQTYERNCLFCRDVVTPNRAAFLEHLFNKHFLNLGRIVNLVYIDELIEEVQDKLNRLICLFCSKTFKDRPTLKEHMRKKGHKRINPDNKAYDKFYLCNYKMDLKSTGARRKENNEYVQAMVSEQSRVFQTPDGSDSDWSDWEGDSEQIACLFCAHTETKFAAFKAHTLDAHLFDLDAALSDLTFYQKVKVVNYIRRQMYTLNCVTCEQQFADKDALATHLADASHCGIGRKEQWDQPEFYFPTYEDDSVLCHLDDGISDSPASASPHPEPDESDGIVIAEEFQSHINADAEALSKEFMLNF